MTDRRPPVHLSRLELPETLDGTSHSGERSASGSVSAPTLGTGKPRYGERHLLGRGGMGEVHLRRDDWLGRDIAIKTLIAERSSLAVARARFLREARVQGQLEHPAIVPVYDVGTDEDGNEYFTMKRVTGRTLKEVLATGDFSLPRLLGVFRQVCLAVDYAHMRGVVHRDLKPANVMVGDFGEVYVLDWGLAKVMGMASTMEEPTVGSGETIAGHMMGTPGYMAPEQLDSAGEVDERADVYALGAMLFEILTGEPLHPGDSVDEKLRSTQAGAAMRPSERAPELDIPPELDALCLTATAHDVAARPLGVRIIADAIERYLEGDRDLAVRRRLAVKHAEAASIAASQALTASPDAIEARARALKEAGRALTLDPENAAGAATLVQLLAQPPSVLPAEVRLEVERAELVAMRLRNRKGIAMLSAFLLIVCAIPIAGLRSWSLWACIVVPLVAALAMTLWVLFSRDLTVPRFERRTDVVVVLGLTAVASCALTMTSSVIVPVLALAFTMGAVGASRPARRPRYLAMGLCAFLVPFVVEWLHLAPDVLPGLQFVPGGAFIPAGATTLPALATRVLLLLATCASILTPMLTVFPVLDAAAELRTQSFLHAWQLRQLAPGEPRSDSAAAVRDPP